MTPELDALCAAMPAVDQAADMLAFVMNEHHTDRPPMTVQQCLDLLHGQALDYGKDSDEAELYFAAMKVAGEQKLMEWPE